MANSTRFVFILIFATCTFRSVAQCSLPAPARIFFTNIKSCSVTVNWSSVKNTSNYTIKYSVNQKDSFITIPSIGTDTFYTLTNLVSNTTYSVKIYPVCSNNKKGKAGTANVTTDDCGVPTNLKTTSLQSTSATISWSGDCSAQKYKFSYRLASSTHWTTTNVTGSSFALSNLIAATNYQARVKSVCGASLSSNWSDSLNFTTLPSTNITKGKNVILILLDDSRQDSYQPSGGPAWFPSPNINRLAYEGANFNLFYPAESSCAPSRATIVTGVYPNKNGIENNPLNHTVDDTLYLPTLSEILHDAGYYDGFIGKYHISNFPQPGYDYWMSAYDSYYNATWDVNGNFHVIPGHQTDVTTDSALGFLKRVPAGKNFFLFLAYHAPHAPFDPQYADTSLFDVDSMPVPADFYQYTKNYPSFLYQCHGYNGDARNLQISERQYFQLLEGVDQSMGIIFNELDSLNAMDSTLILFTSDNGLFLGEHKLKDKELAYKQSLHLPMYMRYPKTIKAGTYINNEIASNLDIAPTILDFAGVNAKPYNMDGLSLLQMLKNKVSRKTFFYEFFLQDCTPDIRAIVTLNDKYIQNHCDTQTEEFYDLNIDNPEDSNVVNNPAYATLVQQFRDSLTFYRNRFDDTVWHDELSCYLINPTLKNEISQSTGDVRFQVYPNPSTSYFTLTFSNIPDAESSVSIYDMLGKSVYENDHIGSLSLLNITTATWQSGFYEVCLKQNGVIGRTSISVVH